MGLFRAPSAIGMLQRVATTGVLIALCWATTILTLFGVAADVDIDHIIDVETEPTMLVVSTSKHGPPDKMKIRVEAVDLQSNAKLMPVELSGIILALTRGRYTIPFLKPDSWYAVKFHSENVVDGKTVTHDEERVVRTAPRGFVADAYSPAVDNSERRPDKLVEVKMHRSLDGVHNPEGLYVTASWAAGATATRSNVSQGVVNVRILCENSETRELIQLRHDEDAVTVEISVDNRYELETVDADSQLVRAHITPFKCHSLCWQSEVVFFSSYGNFSRPVENECREIEGTTSDAHLRRLKTFMVQPGLLSNELIVETEKTGEVEEGFVTLLARKLGANESDALRQIFSTSQSRFVMPIQQDAFYAVQYDYTKVKPFHYNSKANFIVESPAHNSTTASKPLIDMSYLPTTFAASEKNKTKLESPFVLLAHPAELAEHEVLIKLHALCRENSSNVVRLNQEAPKHQVDVSHVLCAVKPTMYFCAKNTSYAGCDEPLCFIPSVRIGADVYQSEKQCVNVTQHFARLDAAVTTQLGPLLVFVALLSILWPSV